MKKYLVLAMFLVLAVVLTSPFSVSAKTKAGTKPGSFFYFFDKAIEKTSLFFIFNPEKKAKKTLEYAEERLAEAEELKKEKEEKEAIEIKKEETKEIKTSEKEIEKTDNKLEEGLEEEKNEETEIKNNQKEETNKKEEQFKEIEALKQKTSQIKVIEKIVEKPAVIEKTQSSNSQTKQKEVTLPNGAVVEMDEYGNVMRTIKEASTYPTPSPVITPAVPIIPSSIKVSTNKLNNYMEITLNPQIEHNERIDIIATVKDIAGNPVSNQTVIFENGYSSAKSITDSDGVADVCFIADSGGVVGGQIVFRQTSIIARVVIPTKSTFIQDTILVNTPIDQNLGNLNRMQQGHLYEFRCQ